MFAMRPCAAALPDVRNPDGQCQKKVLWPRNRFALRVGEQRVGPAGRLADRTGPAPAPQSGYSGCNGSGVEGAIAATAEHFRTRVWKWAGSVQAGIRKRSWK